MGGGLKTNYFINTSETWFLGLGLGWSKNKIEHKSSLEQKSQNSIGLGVHTGFRIPLFKTNFYISPWVSVDYSFLLNKISFEENEYKARKISIFPTVHLGYRF